MVTFRVSADIHDDRQVVLTLPAEVPLGKNELIVSVASISSSETNDQPPCADLADWADKNAEHWGDRLRATDVEGFTGRGG